MPRITTHALCALAALCLALPADADAIIRKKGKPMTEIQIVSVTYKGAGWAKGRAKGEFKWEQIQALEFDTKPFGWDSAVDKLNAGAYADAIPMFTKAIRSDKGVWIKQYSLWNMALCYEGLGDVKNLGATLRRLVKECPKTRYLPDALILLGRVSLSEGKVDEAEAQFDQLITLANEEDLKPQYYRGLLWKGRCQFFKKDFDTALETYRKVSGSTSRSMKALHLKAKVGEGKCLVAKKRFTEARIPFEKVINEGKAASVLAGAYNGMGETYYYASAPQMEKALRAFLKVVVLFDSARDELPKALWHAAKCFHKLKGTNTEWAARSAQLRNQLREQFPRSPWTKKW